MSRVGMGTAIALALLALGPAAAGAAVITPNVTTDDFDAPGSPDANCSLREAIQAAVSNGPYGGCPAGGSGTDTIPLTVDPMSDSYEITVGSNGNNTNAEGDFDVGGGGPIVIRGTDHQQIDTLAPDRIFDVRTGADLTLENLIVHGGDTTSNVTEMNDLDGGNIRAATASTLTLNDVIVRFGDAERGGGIYAGSSNQLTINDSRIENNHADDVGGGILGISSGALSIQINRSRIRDNTVSSTNPGEISGGGIWFSGEQMTIQDSEVLDNAVRHDGVGAPDAATGGGIKAGADVTVRRSLIAENTVETDGDGVEQGGAIMVAGGDETEAVTVVNSTIYGNTAGDADNSGEGGAIFTDGVADADTFLTHVTLRANNATGSLLGDGDNLETEAGAGAGTITVRGSILPGVGLDDACAGDKIFSAGFNATASGDDECHFLPSDVTTGSPGLADGAPTDNGGLVKTIPLEAGGTAIDLEPAASCTGESQDQRGVSRPQGAGCDAGAFELECTTPSTLPGCPPLPPSDGESPDNSFTIVKVKRNKRKGTGKLIVEIPGPGSLELARTGKLKRANAHAEAGGRLRLAVRSRGGAKRKLGELGKVRVKAKVTYTPTGGDPSTRSQKLTLVKRSPRGR